MLNGWKNSFLYRPRRQLRLCICVGVLSIVAGRAVAVEAGYQFDMPAQPMGTALIRMAVTTNISLGGANPALCGATAPALHGRYTAETGLKILLKNSACEVVRVDASSYRLQVRNRLPLRPGKAQLAEAETKEVIVTANRRPQFLGRAPTAVSVVTAGMLAMNDKSLADVASGVSGMILTNLGSGRDKILLRGVSDGIFTGRTQSTVGLYLDDAPITYSAPDPDLLLVDMARVEVLKGPQGALYGEGSISGIVRLITQPADPAQTSGTVNVDLPGKSGERSSV